jgi:hypothetical protein
MKEAIWQERPDKWWNGWMLHHDTVPCHTSLSIHQFLKSRTFLCYHNQPTVLTYHHVTFSCSPHSKKWWKRSNFTRLKTSFPSHTICGWFQKKTYRNVSNSGRSTGTSVCVPEGSTLKEINDKTGIRSFTKLFDLALHCHVKGWNM